MGVGLVGWPRVTVGRFEQGRSEAAYGHLEISKRNHSRTPALWAVTKLAFLSQLRRTSPRIIGLLHFPSGLLEAANLVLTGSNDYGIQVSATTGTVAPTFLRTGGDPHSETPSGDHYQHLNSSPRKHRFVK